MGHSWKGLTSLLITFQERGLSFMATLGWKCCLDVYLFKERKVRFGGTSSRMSQQKGKLSQSYHLQ
jgi:hypothetical protein